MSPKQNIGPLSINTVIDMFFEFDQLTQPDIDEFILYLGLDDLFNLNDCLRREILHLIMFVIVLSVYDVNEEDVPSCFKTFYDIFQNIILDNSNNR